MEELVVVVVLPGLLWFETEGADVLACNFFPTLEGGNNCGSVAMGLEAIIIGVTVLAGTPFTPGNEDKGRN